MDITELDAHKLFIKLFRETLKHQLREGVFSRVGVVWDRGWVWNGTAVGVEWNGSGSTWDGIKWVEICV